MAQRVTEVKATQVLRIPTHIEELDWMYGYLQKGSKTLWGLPSGKMSLWAGEKGTGKSRASIEICRTVARRVQPGGTKYNVLYFQREVDLGTLAGWVKEDGGVMPDNLYVSRANTVSQQVAEIKRHRPMLVIVDSINMVKDFRGNSEEKIELAIEGDGKGSPCYREVCQDIGCHIIFLCQLNKDGTPKGSSSIAHLMDVEMILKRNGDDGFSMACPQKNRYGKTGVTSWWVHNRQRAYAESTFRLEDEDWCRTHNLVRRDIKKEGEAYRQVLIKKNEQEIQAYIAAEEAAHRKAYFDQMGPMKNLGRWCCGMDTR